MIKGGLNSVPAELETPASAHCRALFISAPASGQGKTTVTAALARCYRNLGQQVCVFKCGPDYLDPMILEQASGGPVYQLDLWMGGEDDCRERLYQAALDADLILIEGVMGLFDGDPSSADLATLFGIPVLAVIDASAMAQTFGAIAYGLTNYRKDLPFAGVFANRVASDGHYQMLAESLGSGSVNLGWLIRDSDIALPERHLGIVQAEEIDDLETRISHAAESLNLIQDSMPARVTFNAPQTTTHAPDLKGVRIAIARDQAFAFLYRANFDLLKMLGAKLEFFSPLSDSRLPETDALYLPGGYPELHLTALAANQTMQESIRAHQMAEKPIVAECGGMLYLMDSLSNIEGHSAPMVGLLQGKASMQARLSNIGLHRVRFPEGELRGHTFHHSLVETELEPLTCSQSNRHHGKPEAVYRQGRLTASYMHLYFPSEPRACAQLFRP